MKREERREREIVIQEKHKDYEMTTFSRITSPLSLCNCVGHVVWCPFILLLNLKGIRWDE